MKILFVCTGNSCRSPMAEGMARVFFKSCEIASAGIYPESIVSAVTVEVLSDIGIDISRHHPRHINSFMNFQPDLVVCFGTLAHEFCKQSFKNCRVKFFDVKDPFGTKGTREEVKQVYNETRDEIMEIIQRLLNEY